MSEEVPLLSLFVYYDDDKFAFHYSFDDIFGLLYRLALSSLSLS